MIKLRELNFIEDAPEGVELMLWSKLGLPWSDEKCIKTYSHWKIGNYNYFDHNHPHMKDAVYFTLWPTIPKVKNSWDNYTDNSNDFLYPDGLYCIRKNGEEVNETLMALRDFLNHYYPKKNIKKREEI